ncbi:MAG: inositol-3-phosphate synthase [Deltaproteobacteria bacterium]|nr:inositol-3-phosphate synthase [Deltaproteobacteria bacterium]
MKPKKLGVWLIGALGSVSSAVILGTLALKHGLTGTTGMITATEPFEKLDLVPAEAIEFGGCDIREGSLRESIHGITQEIGGNIPADLRDLDAHLVGIEGNFVPGSARNCGDAIECLMPGVPRGDASLREEIARVIGQFDWFRKNKALDDVVVVNLASTEPPVGITSCHKNIDALEKCLDENREDSVRASTIYAYSAIESGCAYINFTPSNGALFPAMIQFAERKGVPVMGNDGKTGETLVKSALAPMFQCRNLEILSWEGFNILGNLDGRVLNCLENKESKLKTKDGVLSQLLGYDIHSRVEINYVPSLSNQKIAWDFIHFRGFLDAKMSLQFIWQGFDSLLAAPLVLDLVRLAELAMRRGEAGLMPHLACYFKAPLGVNEHRLYEQYRMLMNYVTERRPSAVQ